MPNTIPSVAIIGRTNVGKSTLFNRFLEKRRSITSSVPGTTRDRISALCVWNGTRFFLIDSGGLDINKNITIEVSIRQQAEIAIKNAQVIVFVCDGQQGISAEDREIAKRLKKSKKQVILAVNKIDKPRLRTEQASFFRLGLGSPYLVSASNGSGTGDLLDEIVNKINAVHTVNDGSSGENTANILRLAILGKTNAGKSSFVNSLLNEERIIVSPEPHTTRDPHEIEFKFQGHNMILIDTAGLRRKKIGGKEKNVNIEKESAKKSLSALRNADVALLMMDISDQITFQDRRIAQEILDSNTGIIVAANKSDLIQNKTEKVYKQYLLYIKSHFSFLAWAPAVFMSALRKTGMNEVLKKAIEIKEGREKRIEPKKLTEFLGSFNDFFVNSKNGKYSAADSLAQTGINPPQFVLDCEPKKNPSQEYQDSMKNALREEFGFIGTPIILRINQRLKK